MGGVAGGGDLYPVWGYTSVLYITGSSSSAVTTTTTERVPNAVWLCVFFMGSLSERNVLFKCIYFFIYLNS